MLLQGAIAALLHHKMFPQHRVARSHEPWYETTQAPDSNGDGGSGNSKQNLPQLVTILFAAATATLARVLTV